MKASNRRYARRVRTPNFVDIRLIIMRPADLDSNGAKLSMSTDPREQIRRSSDEIRPFLANRPWAVLVDRSDDQQRTMVTAQEIGRALDASPASPQERLVDFGEAVRSGFPALRSLLSTLVSECQAHDFVLVAEQDVMTALAAMAKARLEPRWLPLNVSPAEPHVFAAKLSSRTLRLEYQAQH